MCEHANEIGSSTFDQEVERRSEAFNKIQERDTAITAMVSSGSSLREAGEAYSLSQVAVKFICDKVGIKSQHGQFGPSFKANLYPVRGKAKKAL